ncbi:9788_t:CDS:10, partial [Entrophospora sp. SA101]
MPENRNNSSNHSKNPQRRLFSFLSTRNREAIEVALEIEYNERTKVTSASKIYSAQSVNDMVAEWSETIVFEFYPKLRTEICFRCWDKSKGPRDRIGDAKEDLKNIEIFSNENHKVTRELFKGEKKVGEISFEVYFLSKVYSNPLHLDEKIGVLLINDIRCEGVNKEKNFNFLLEFSINESKAYQTISYQKIVYDRWKYPVAILLKSTPEINLILRCRYRDNVFFNSKIELAKGSVKESTGLLWQRLMQSTVIKAPFSENNGVKITLSISCHELLSLKHLFENYNENPIPTPVRRSRSTFEKPDRLSEGNSFYPPIPRSKRSLQQIPNYKIVCNQLSTSPNSLFNDNCKETPSKKYETLPATNNRTSNYSDISNGSNSTTSRKTSLDSLDKKSDVSETRKHAINGDIVVIKIFNQKHPWKNDVHFLRTCSTYKSRKSIVKFEDMEELGTENFVSVTRYFGRTLDSELSKLRDPMLLKLVFNEITKGLNYLHTNNIVHNNLKPSNILLKENKIYKVKLCDFEFARNVGELVQNEDGSHCVNTGFSPPEIAKNHKNLKADLSADCFSLGAILYYLLAKKKLYTTIDELDSLAVDRFEYFEYEIKEKSAIKLLSMMLNPAANKRPKVEMILESTYFKGGDGDPGGSVKDIQKMIYNLHKKTIPTSIMVLPAKKSEQIIPPIKQWGKDTFELFLLCEGLGLYNDFPAHITDHPGYKIHEPTSFFRHSAKALAVSIGILQAGLIIGTGTGDLKLFEAAGSIWKSSEKKLDKFKKLKKFIEDNNIGSSKLEQVLNKYDKTSTYGSLSLVILKETADVKW